MDVSTLVITTRAILLGLRTFAGTGIGPPVESAKIPVVCGTPGVLLPKGIVATVAVTGGRTVASSVGALPWLAAFTASIRQAMITASPATSHPQWICV